MKNICRSTSDIISDLTDNVIETILVLMPLRDAVRTSVLSRKWRYKWRKIPQLVFDNKIILPYQIGARNRFLVTIYHVLLLHRGPILKFTLSISRLESCFEIDTFLATALRNGVQEITLQIWEGEPHKLPSSLFSCQQLTRLILRSCVFTPPTNFKGFRTVVSLELREVVITLDTFQNLVSGCPLLEQLTFETSTSFGFIEIEAPNLKVLNLLGIFESVCVKNAPYLANVSIRSKVPNGDVENWGNPFDMVSFLHCIPVVKNLNIGYQYMKFGSLPKLRHLNNLDVSNVYFGFKEVLGFILAIMHSSPKLHKVVIGAISTSVGPVTKRFIELWHNSSLYLRHLREVEMRLVSGTLMELQLMKIFLAKCPLLESMVVKPDPTKVSDGGLKILKELSQFQRLSPKAKITYKDPNENQI